MNIIAYKAYICSCKNGEYKTSKSFTFYREVGGFRFLKLFTQITGRNSKGGPEVGEATNVYRGAQPSKKIYKKANCVTSKKISNNLLT